MNAVGAVRIYAVKRVLVVILSKIFKGIYADIVDTPAGVGY